MSCRCQAMWYTLHIALCAMLQYLIYHGASFPSSAIHSVTHSDSLAWYIRPCLICSLPRSPALVPTHPMLPFSYPVKLDFSQISHLWFTVMGSLFLEHPSLPIHAAHSFYTFKIRPVNCFIQKSLLGYSPACHNASCVNFLHILSFSPPWKSVHYTLCIRLAMSISLPPDFEVLESRDYITYTIECLLLNIVPDT